MSLPCGASDNPRNEKPPPKEAASHLLSLLRPDLKLHIAGERAAGCGHGDIARGRSLRNRGRQERIGLNGEACRRPIERNAGCASESLAENANRPPHLAQVAHETYERAKSGVEAEDRACSDCSTKRRCPVQPSIGVLNQSWIGVCTARATVIRAKTVERGQRSSWRELEDGASVIGSAV